MDGMRIPIAFDHKVSYNNFSMPTKPFTAKQGQYLAFIHHYTKIHRVPPAEMDLLLYFRTTPPSVHQMVVTLERNGFIEKIPYQPRSIRLLIPPEHLPPLG